MTHPFVTHINFNGTNDCRAYIDKLKFFGTNYSPATLTISASGFGYGNSSYYFEDSQYTNGAVGLDAKNGVIAAGVSTNLVTYRSWDEPHVLSATNVAGFYTWGYNGYLGSEYVTNSNSSLSIKFFGSSSWYLLQTGESYNGVRTNYLTAHPMFLEWFSSIAFGGTNYSNTPVGGVTHVDEPGSPGNNSYVFFGLWARGKLFATCAWNSLNSGFDKVQVVGDPFVTR